MVPKKKKTWSEQIETTLKKIKEENVIVACSGGVDSMVLLELIRKVQDAKNIVVAHVHHGLRKSATRDEKIVSLYCKKHKISVEILRIKAKEEAKKEKMTVEEYARKARQDFFLSISKKYKSDIIVTAHHADDQTKTLIYRMTK